MEVNRYLKDKAMDHIDHALGRPVNPLQHSYRNYFAISIDDPQADEFAASPCWHMGKRLPGDMVYFHVTTHGRRILAAHLKEIGDRHRHFIIEWGGLELSQVATSHGKARYQQWISVSDTCDISFKDFAKTARVRLAR